MQSPFIFIRVIWRLAKQRCQNTWRGVFEPSVKVCIAEPSRLKSDEKSRSDVGRAYLANRLVIQKHRAELDLQLITVFCRANNYFLGIMEEYPLTCPIYMAR